MPGKPKDEAAVDVGSSGTVVGSGTALPPIGDDTRLAEHNRRVEESRPDPEESTPEVLTMTTEEIEDRRQEHLRRVAKGR